jgi:hypothetical protein
VCGAADAGSTDFCKTRYLEREWKISDRKCLFKTTKLRYMVYLSKEPLNILPLFVGITEEAGIVHEGNPAFPVTRFALYPVYLEVIKDWSSEECNWETLDRLQASYLARLDALDAGDIPLVREITGAKAAADKAVGRVAAAAECTPPIEKSYIIGDDQAAGRVAAAAECTPIEKDYIMLWIKQLREQQQQSALLSTQI